MSEHGIRVPHSVATALKWTWLIIGRTLSVLLATFGSIGILMSIGMPDVNAPGGAGALIGFVASAGLFFFVLYKAVSGLWSVAYQFETN